MADKEFPGLEERNTQADQFNAERFLVDQAIGRMSKVMLVKVTKVTTQGQVGPVGFVDVVPLVKQTDSKGQVKSHGTVHSISYFRYQGGAGKAVILDPKVGDIGVAVFADRDISVVKKTKKESQPGSFRQHSMADGLFFGCFLGDAPTCYIRFTDDDKIVLSPDGGTSVMTLEAGKTTIKAESIVLDGLVKLGGEGADRPLSAEGTTTTDGASDNGNFLTKVLGL